MRKTLAMAASAAILMAGMAAGAQAAPISPQDPNLIQARVFVYFWSGHRYCWYDDGWQGPGWYWCGYPWRDGIGWGGPFGWRGWRGGHEGRWDRRDDHRGDHWDRGGDRHGDHWDRGDDRHGDHWDRDHGDHGGDGEHHHHD
jgi:hypothetical protein